MRRRQQVNIRSNSSTHRAIKYNVQPATSTPLPPHRLTSVICPTRNALITAIAIFVAFSLSLSRSAIHHSLIIMQAKRFAKVLLAAFAYFDMQAQRVKLIFNSHPNSVSAPYPNLVECCQIIDLNEAALCCLGAVHCN